jgi:hypothetical protein
VDKYAKLELARQRASSLLTLGDAFGSVDQGAIRKAALAPLSPISERAAALLGQLILVNLESVAVILAGLADDEVLTKLLAVLDREAQAQVPPSEATPDM